MVPQLSMRSVQLVLKGAVRLAQGGCCLCQAVARTQHTLTAGCICQSDQQDACLQEALPWLGGAAAHLHDHNHDAGGIDDAGIVQAPDEPMGTCTWGPTCSVISTQGLGLNQPI